MIRPLVAVVMGSKSDGEYLESCLEQLDRLDIGHESHVMSAHRTPELVREFAEGAGPRGIEVIIAAAGGAAALPGMLKAYSPLPIIGVPLPTSELRGIDALLAMAQMPPGIPVATMAIGRWGARNAALLAAEILALKHPPIRQKYEAFRREQSEAV